jgi:uncharacterized DUF497 family protein
LLQPHEQQLTFDDAVEILMQSALDEAEESEPESEERTMTVVKMTEGIGLTEACIEVFEGIDCHVQRAATELGISSLACLI